MEKMITEEPITTEITRILTEEDANVKDLIISALAITAIIVSFGLWIFQAIAICFA
jgi:multisubunit Na+/H+ antiporter MnhC subunit